jgi:hypothetical protein
LGAAVNGVKDKDEIPNVIQALKSLSDRQLEIGIMGANAQEYVEGASLTMLELAKVLHEGCNTETVWIPARPWLDVSIPRGDTFSKSFLNNLFDEIARAPAAFSGKAKWEALGSALASMMKKDMVDLKEPANRPSTIQKKGSDNPLVDTGHLVGSVAYELRRL